MLLIITIITILTIGEGEGGKIIMFSVNLMVRMTIMSLKAVLTSVVASSIYHLLYRTQ